MDRPRSWSRASLLGIGALGLAGSSLLVATSGTSAARRGSPVLRVLAPRSFLSASTCACNTCQFIDGAGTSVNEWYSQTTAPSAVCTHANFYASGTLVAQSTSGGGLSQGREGDSYG